MTRTLPGRWNGARTGATSLTCRNTWGDGPPELTATATILRVPGGPWADENIDEVEHGVPGDVYEGELEGRGLLTPQCYRLIAEYIAEVEGVTVDEVDEVEIFRTMGWP